MHTRERVSEGRAGAPVSPLHEPYGGTYWSGFDSRDGITFFLFSYKSTTNIVLFHREESEID